MTDVFKLIEEHGLTLHGDIEHFAELVRADEREACAALCSAVAAGRDAEAIEEAIKARGDVHASDISQERVDETAKREHEWVGLDGDIPGLGLVTEEFYNGILCAEDILRKRNT